MRRVVEVAEVGRRLQHPAVRDLAALPLLPLQQLEHPVQVVVGRREVLGVDPGPVHRHVRAGLGDVREERVGEEDDLLLGLAGVHRVDREQVRHPLPRLLLTGHGLRDARVGDRPVVVELRRDLDDLPPVGAVEAVVGGEQSLHQRRTAAHHADHDDRRGHDLVGDLRVPAEPLGRPQPHPQAVHGRRPQQVRAHRR